MNSLGEIFVTGRDNRPDSHIVFPLSTGEIVLDHEAFVQASLERLSQLQTAGLTPQQYVLLQLSDTREFLLTLTACLIGGMVPVPLGVPQVYDPERQAVKRMLKALEILPDPILVTGTEHFELVKEIIASSRDRSSEILNLNQLGRSQREASMVSLDAAPNADAVALIMLTSGTTGTPKLVQLTHRNILTSICGSIRANGYRPPAVSLNWLPLSHIGALMRFLRDFRLGAKIIQADYTDILRNALSWLDLIDRYRVNLTWAPNFAFRLVLDAMEEKKPTPDWDLSCVKSLHTSGEPIAANTVLKFAELLEPHGLRPEAMHTAWGMTEACFATCSHTYLTELREKPDSVPSVGRPIEGLEIRIVDQSDRVIEDGSRGLLQIRGALPSIGYYGDASRNRSSFSDDGWFRTGDLAYRRGEVLTVLGRESSLLILNGVNYAAVEIESVVETVPGVLPTEVAACSVQRFPGGDHELAIFYGAESSRNPINLKPLICSTLARRMGISPAYLIPLSSGEIPKTESGKIRRTELQQRFAAEACDHSPPRPAVRGRRAEPRSVDSSDEETVLAIFSGVLKVPDLQPRDDFFAHGGSSLRVLEAVTALREAYPGTEVTTTEIFRHPTAAALAVSLSDHPTAPEGAKTNAARGFERAALRRAALQRTAFRRAALTDPHGSLTGSSNES